MPSQMPRSILIDDVRMFLDERQAARNRGKPHHRQERHVDDFQAGAFRQNIRRRRDERRISFAVAHRFPMKLTALGFLHLAFVDQPGLLDKQPSIQARDVCPWSRLFCL